MKPPEKWSTKEQAAKYLGLQTRRIETLIQEQRWPTKKARLPGRRQAARLIRFQDLEAYKAGLHAPTLDEQGREVARPRPKPAQPAMAVAVAGALDRLAVVAEAQASSLNTFRELSTKLLKVYELTTELVARLAPPKRAYEPHQYVSISRAAKHVGLPRTYLLAACERRRLAFVEVGGPRSRRLMVRVGDVENLDAEPALARRAP